MSVADYNTDPDSNTSISGINVAEGCPPSGINNAIRQMMADVKMADDANVKLSGDQTVGGVKNFNGLKITSLGNIVKENNTGQTLVCAGTTNSATGGAYLTLRGAEASTNPGRFALTAAAGGATKQFIGNTDGTLTWDGKDIAIDENVVHISGDETISGSKTFGSAIIRSSTVTNPTLKTASNASVIRIWGSAESEKGASLTLIGDDFTGGSNAGYFYLTTGNDASNNRRSLMATPNGSLAWDGKHFVYDTEDQTIAGNKTFSNKILAPGIENPSGQTRVQTTYGGVTKYLQLSNSTGRAGVNTDLAPTSSGQFLLGLSNGKWKEIWCTQSSINSSSDERIKQQIADVPDAVLDAWGDVDWMQFKYNDAVAEKGADKARLHNGLIAQRVDAAFKAHGLDAAQYGLFLYDAWDAEPEEKDADGNVTQEAQPAGDAYGLRYTEALCMEAAYQRRRADRAEARISALERRLDEMEAAIAALGE